MRKHWKVVLSALMLIPLIVTGAGLAASDGRPLSTLTIGFIPIADCLQLYVAEEMGFFEEEGLKIEKRSLKGGSVIAVAVESGEVDIGWSNTVSIITARSKGFDYAFIVPGAFEAEPDHRTHSLLVAKDSPIQEIAELSGKKVAINTLGNVNELSLAALADSNGIGVQSIRLVELPFPDMEPALKNGSVDAALVAEPFVSLSISHGTCRFLEKSVHKSFGDRFMIASWFAKRSWVEKNSAKAAAFARAIHKASRHIVEHPEDMPKILTQNTKLSPELSEKIILPAFQESLDPDELQRMIVMAARYKLINAPFSAEEIIHRPAGLQ